MRRSWVAAVVAAEVALLLLYYRYAPGVWITPGQWLDSFHWEPVSGEFAWGPFLGLWLMNGASVLSFLACLMLAWSVGSTVLRRVGWSEDAADRRALLALGLGLGALSLLGFALATAGLLSRGAVLIVFGALFSLCIWDERRAGVKGRIRLPEVPPTWQGVNPYVAAVAGLCSAVLVFHFLGALLPPVAFDEMTYQLSVPKLYAMSGSFEVLRFNHLSLLPRNMNMLFTLGLLIGGPVAAKLFSWTCGVLACAALFSFGREFLGARAAFLAAAAFFLTPVVGNQFRLAVVDLGMAFYELTAVFLFLRWRQYSRARTLALASAFWGLALGCKYSAIPGFAACALVLAWTLWRLRVSARARLEAACAFVLPALALWAPWLARNWWDTGNPVSPIFSTWIRSRNFFFAGEYKPLVDYSRGLGIPNYFPIFGAADLARLPWRLLTLHNDFNHDLGALILLCAPLLILARSRKRPPALSCAAVLCALYWAFWLASGIRMSRYFVAGLGLTSLCAGWLLDAAFAAPEFSGALVLPVLFAWAQQGARTIYIQNVHKQPWGFLAGRCALREYVNGALVDSPYDAYDYVNANAPADARVLVVDEFRTFYLDRRFLASTPWDHDYWHETVRLSRDCGEIGSRLKTMGVDYLVVNDNYIRHSPAAARPDPWTAEDTSKSRRFLRACLRRLFTSGEGVWVAKFKEES